MNLSIVNVAWSALTARSNCHRYNTGMNQYPLVWTGFRRAPACTPPQNIPLCVRPQTR